MIAAFNGYTDVVHALVSAGADVNLQRNDSVSPLMVASQEGHIDCVKLLVQSGAAVEVVCSDIGLRPLYMAASNGHIEVVQFLIKQHAVVNACNNDGQSCLLTAAFNGHTDVVCALVSAGADVNLQRNDGASPLMAASQNGHIDCVKLLVQSGAEVGVRDSRGATPLYRAAKNGHIEVLQFLIEQHADIDIVDYRVMSPLGEAAVQGHIDVVNRLMHHKANVIGEVEGLTDPLTCVATWGKREVKAILQSLIDSGSFVGNANNHHKTSALIRALYKGDIDIVIMLVECGADIHARDADGLQAIDIASYCGHADIVQFLSDRLPSINYSNTFNHFDSISVSASYLSSSTRIDCVGNTAVHVTTDVQCMGSLLENGADVEAENFDGLRPIHCAVRTGLVELVELLIQHGANVDAADVYGNSPLHDAVCHGLNVVQLLVHHGAKVNVQNVDGKSPLYMAVDRQQSEVITFLLNAGADVGLTDVWHNTPLHYLTSGQMHYAALEKCVAKQTKRYQYLLIRNAVGLTAISSMASHRLLDYANNKQQISHIAGQTDSCSEQMPHALSSAMIACLLELQHIKALSKSKVYCREMSAPTSSDCYGNTPLHHAVGVYGHLKLYKVSTDVRKTVEFLMKRGADINAQNNDGLTPLHVARGKEAIRACLQHANDQSLSITDKRGCNFFHFLFLLWNLNEIRLAQNIWPIISASDAKYNSDDLNRTPLHYACMKINAWIAQWSSLAEEFIKEFSEEYVDKQDRFGRTALHYAAMANNTELVDLLRKKKSADDMVQDNFDKTANEYGAIYHNYRINVSNIQLVNTSSLVARNFHSILVCIQQCFSHRYPNMKSSTAELHKIVCSLRADDATSFVLKTYKGCRFGYPDVVYQETAALKQRFQKQVQQLATVNESVTQPSVMFTAIQSQVEKAMQHLAEQISNNDVRFACEVVPVGSAHEGTNIGCCDEFDFNFVLTDLSKRCTVCYSPDSPPGFVLLTASVPGYDEDLFDINGILNTRIVKFKFETLVKQVLSSLSFSEATGFEFIYPFQYFFMSPPGTTLTKLHTEIKLEFTAPLNGYHVPHDISVDIVPAIRIDGWLPYDDDMHRKDVCQANECLIVFTQPQVKYPWISWTEPHGFISFAQAESRLL